jgi:hypothetical protein
MVNSIRHIKAVDSKLMQQLVLPTTDAESSIQLHGMISAQLSG